MRIAIFSDIHANWESLQAAVAYSQSHSVDRYVVLGDTIGYGANPNECLDWTLRNASVNLMGNHEKAVHDVELRDVFTDWAREAIVWTEKVLDPLLKKEIRNLSFVRSEETLTFCHGSFHEPEAFHYLRTYEDALPSFKKMERRLCLVGHTHIPCCFCESARSARHLAPGILPLDSQERYILNPGSVGQPRDRDSRLSFGILDSPQQTFEIVRLEYDKKKAAEKIRRAGLPRSLADRLL